MGSNKEREGHRWLFGTFGSKEFFQHGRCKRCSVISGSWCSSRVLLFVNDKKSLNQTKSNKSFACCSSAAPLPPSTTFTARAACQRMYPLFLPYSFFLKTIFFPHAFPSPLPIYIYFNSLYDFSLHLSKKKPEFCFFFFTFFLLLLPLCLPPQKKNPKLLFFIFSIAKRH